MQLHDLQIMLQRLCSKGNGRAISEDVGLTAAVQLRRAKKHKSDKFSIGQMLPLLETAVSFSSACLYFDLLKLYMSCADVMRVVIKVQYSNPLR